MQPNSCRLTIGKREGKGDRKEKKRGIRRGREATGEIAVVDMDLGVPTIQ
jgi:hypothetical protein